MLDSYPSGTTILLPGEAGLNPVGLCGITILLPGEAGLNPVGLCGITILLPGEAGLNPVGLCGTIIKDVCELDCAYPFSIVLTSDVVDERKTEIINNIEIPNKMFLV